MVTAKEIAKILGISEASVSIALNGRQGVSDNLRRRVLETAQAIGYDFSRLNKINKRDIIFIMFIKSGAVVSDTPFFEQLIKGVAAECKNHNIRLTTIYSNTRDDLRNILNTTPRNTGIILLATEMEEADCLPIVESTFPHLFLDAYFENIDSNYVLINNVRGAYLATDYLIRSTGKQPGYLRSSYSIPNFEERADGFYKAIRSNGKPTSRSIVHRLCPSVEGAYLDMREHLLSGEPIASCYFADNDLIAAGAMRAFKSVGKRIPEDIAIVGFDDISLCECLDPPLSTINVPKEYMGSQAVIRLLSIMEKHDVIKTKTEINTQLVLRQSVGVKPSHILPEH